MRSNIATIDMPKSIPMDAPTPIHTIHMQMFPQKDIYERGEIVHIAIWIDGGKDIPFDPIAIDLTEQYEDKTNIFQTITLIPGQPFIATYIIPGTTGMGAISRHAIKIEAIGPEGSGIIARIDNISIIN